MDNISEHITYVEATKSNTAIRMGIKNIPNEQELANMRMVAKMCFEPAREHFGVPIYVSSFFRCRELNRELRGSHKSQHCAGTYVVAEEAAIDCDQDGHDDEGPANSELFYWLKENVPYDQLIWEYGGDPAISGTTPAWVHMGYRAGENGLGENRNSVLRAVRGEDGRTKYIPFNG